MRYMSDIHNKRFYLQNLKTFLMDTLSILRALAEIESPSGKEEEIAGFLLEYLRDLGYDAFMEQSNVLIFPERKFIVSTHMDTVKVLTPFSFDGEYAYGTEVCDAKASIVAILLDLEMSDELNFGVAFFHDEEGEGRGSKEFCMKHSPKMAVVMEPTCLTIANIHYGGLEVRVRAKGLPVHGSIPERGENAVEKCIEKANRLMEIREAKVSVQYIGGGNMEHYAIPDECEMRLEFIFKPNVKSSDILRRVSEICSDGLELTVKEIHDGFVSGSVVRLLEEALRRTGLEIKFSEMPSLTDAIELHHHVGCNAVVFGPSELNLCHTRNERVKPRDIELAAKVLAVLNDLLERQS